MHANLPSCTQTIDFSQASWATGSSKQLDFVDPGMSTSLFNAAIIPGSFLSQSTRLWFMYCSEYNKPVTIPSQLTNCASMFQYCSNFNQPVTIPSGATNCREMFRNCTEFNQPVSVPNGCLDASYIVAGCRNFNSDIYIPDGCSHTSFINDSRSGYVEYKGNISLPGTLTVTNTYFNNASHGVSIKYNNRISDGVWGVEASKYWYEAKVTDRASGKTYRCNRIHIPYMSYTDDSYLYSWD